jgi:lipoprotein-anchoring transpeptidase ErfK/SrfK
MMLNQMNLHTILKWLIAATGAAAISSCAPTSRHVAQTPVAFATAPPSSPERTLYEWYDDGGPGEVAIRISLSGQMATITRGGREIGWSYVTTGRPGQGTPSGSFTITEKTVDKYSNRWGTIVDAYGNTVNTSARNDAPRAAGERWVAAPMPYWMRLTSSGIGMHAGPIPRPGTPVSAGCIRFPRGVAPRIFDAVRIGTRVTIVG